MGQCELEYANYALKTLLKGLKFFHPVFLSESPRVMALTNIHHPDTLCHFNRVTHCSWCRKEGQNEGTIISHLQMTHYKLGLVCKKCFCCPSVTSEAIWHHSQKSCQPSTEGGPDKSSSSAWPQVWGSLDQHSKDRTWMEDQKEDLTSVRLPHWGCPYPIDMELKGGSGRGTLWYPPNGSMHIIPIFLHPTQIPVMWGCLPHKLAPSHCAWWSDYCHLRIWCKLMYPTPSARYTCPIGHLASCMELSNITSVQKVRVKIK